MISNLHQPVLLNETISLLSIKPNGVYVDCTCGRGGHSNEILSLLNNKGRLICLDADQQAFEFLLNKFKNNKQVTLIKSNFSNIKKVLSDLNITKVDGILADLGVSSPMFDNSDRGFSYHKDARLDMRMNQEQQLDAFKIINHFEKADLIKIFKEYGEIKNPSFVVNAIINQRKIQPIETTEQLVDLIKANVSKKELYSSKHPARLYFQALRIAVNDELNNLTKLLENSLSLLNPDGRLVIITFHSLEDRIVKQFFNNSIKTNIPKEVPIFDQSTDFELVNKKPIVPSEEEINSNHRARSAKCRAIRRKN